MLPCNNSMMSYQLTLYWQCRSGSRCTVCFGCTYICISSTAPGALGVISLHVPQCIHFVTCTQCLTLLPHSEKLASLKCWSCSVSAGCVSRQLFANTLVTSASSGDNMSGKRKQKSMNAVLWVYFQLASSHRHPLGSPKTILQTPFL